MKIYTRTGDAGQTGLFGGGRVAKDDPRVAAYGEVDELNATIGVARTAGLGGLDPWCQDLQDQLFTVGAVLATPRGTRADAHIPHLREEWVAAMESRIDELQVTLRFLNRLSDFLFVLARAANHRAGVKDVPWIPGGTPSP